MEAMPFIKIPLTGKYGTGKHALVDADYDGEYFAQFKWAVNTIGYVVRKDYQFRLNTKTGESRMVKNSIVYLHDEVCKKPKGYWADHINRDKLDNRSCNLRPVTPKESAQNRDNQSRWRNKI